MTPVPSIARRPSAAAAATIVMLALFSACDDPARVRTPDTSAAPRSSQGDQSDAPRTWGRTVTAPTVEPDLPLAGRVVVLDPGHQLGNAAFPAEVGALVDAGGFTKACNTTGTATDSGYAEATFTWQVARTTRRLLRRLGALVLLTRTSNSADHWGPCVDVRGRAGNPGEPGPTGDLKVSIHADGSLAPGAHGFHVIAPDSVAPWTTDIAAPSLRLAELVRDVLVEEGFATSTYAGSNGVDLRVDLGTLNLSDIPTVVVELGNMRDAGDAETMTSAAGRRHYASALARAVERFSAR